MSDRLPTFAAAVRALRELRGQIADLLHRAPTSLRLDPLVLLRELSAMLRSGVALPQALLFVGDSFGPVGRRRLDRVRARVESGERLSEALASLPSWVAPPPLRAAVAAGERCGRLPELLEEIAEEHERLTALDRRVRSFFLYPIVVLLLASCILYILAWKVTPILATLYEGLGATLPRLTVVVYRLGGRFATWLALGLLALLVYQVATFGRPPRLGSTTPFGRLLAWRLPLVRGLHRALVELRFARTLRLLLEAGVALPEALDLCEPVVADGEAGVAVVGAARRIRDGERPSAALGGLSFLSPAFLWFLAGSEARGDFLDVTRAMAEAAEERFLTRLELLERLVEPVGTVLLGLVVGAVVIAAYQPMFGLITQVGN
jgi:type II secretory pathway component PulF